MCETLRAVDDLLAAAQWGRRRDIPVFSDECYAEFTWDGPARTILAADQALGAGKILRRVLVERERASRAGA